MTIAYIVHIKLYTPVWLSYVLLCVREREREREGGREREDGEEEKRILFNTVFFSLHEQVIADNSSGLLFKNKSDRKIVTVDPKVRK